MRNLVLLTETERSAVSVVAHAASDRVVDVRPDPHVGGVLVLTERGALARFDDDDDEPRRSTRLDPTRRWFRVDPHPDGRGAVALSDRGVVAWDDPVGGGITTVYAAVPGATVRDGRWSPDGEVLCLCCAEENDGALSLVTLNAEFEPLRVVVVASSVRSSGRASVSWRPDGAAIALCACATDGNDDGSATTRLWIRDRDDLATTAVGREEDGAGRLARWLDDGAGAAWGGDHVDFVVAAVRRRPASDKPPTVVFFEPNGLRHRDFDGRDANAATKDLAWNADSDLLATVSDKSVRLWSRSNWTWYLKRDVRLADADDATIVRARFDEEDPHRLLVLLDDARWLTYDFAWDHATVDAAGTAASVDGTRLKVTPLARTIVPPPMCLHAVDLPANANEVAHCDLHHANNDDDVGKRPSMVATLSDGSLAVMSGYAALKEGASRRPPQEPPVVMSVVRAIEGLDTSSSLSLRHVTVLDHDPVSFTLTLTAVVRRSSSVDELLELRLSLGEDAARVEHRVVLEGRVLRSCPVRSRGSTVVRREEKVVLQLLDGALCSYLGDGLVLPFDDADGDDALGEPCPWMSVIVDDDDDASRRHANPLVVGRSRHHRLWRGDVVLDDAVSSHVVDDESLCFATLGAAAAVRALSLAALRDHDPLDVVADHHHHERPLERGSVLLTSSSRDCRVVVQVQPRGSLEAAHPRALVVPRACRLATTERDVGAAVELARKQRLDLNLLVDLDPRRFLDGVGARELVDGVLDVSPDPADRLTLFVANLRSGEDVTAERHRVPPDVPRSSTWADDGLDLSDKVNAACRALRSALSERDDDPSLLFPTLATLAREEPPRLEDALLLARDRRPDDRPAALAYLASLADWTSLYRAALGTHDLDLARAVARESPDADPRDYGPKLRRWRDLRPFSLAKYEIDSELGRHDAALRHLVEGRADAIEGRPWFETCLSLVGEHRLHETALELFPAADKGSTLSDERRRILSSLGERLLREVDGASAATTVFLAAGNVDGARRAARAAGDWRTLWDAHVNDEQDDVDLPALAASIAEDLVAGAAPADFRAVRRDAATLLAEHAGDVDGAIDSLIEGAWWEEALRRAGSSAPRRARVVDGARRRLLEETLPDLEERAETSVRAIERHDVVATLLRTRGDHDPNEDPPPHGSHDQDGQSSVYSAATDATAASLRSVASVNSVISAGDRSTFSITSVDDAHKHKSKYNRVGQHLANNHNHNKKKRKKKKRHRHNKGKSSVARPNTRAELDDLVATLRGARVDDDERDVLENAARCLARAGRTADARAAIATYARCRDAVETARRRRGTDPTAPPSARVDDAAAWPAPSAETTRMLAWL